MYLEDCKTFGEDSFFINKSFRRDQKMLFHNKDLNMKKLNRKRIQSKKIIIFV